MIALPDAVAEQAEAAIDALLWEQHHNEAVWRAWIQAMRAQFEHLRFPLGGPARGYEAMHISAILAEWIECPPDRDKQQQAAADLVRNELGIA